MSLIDPVLGEAKCKRLPRHKGDHRATLHEVKVAKVAKPKASKIVTIDGVKFAVTIVDGAAYIAPVTAKPSASPKGKVTTIKTGPSAQRKIEASRVQRPKAAKRRGNEYVTSGKPSSRLA
jgi:hypothetical protein